MITQQKSVKRFHDSDFIKRTASETGVDSFLEIRQLQGGRRLKIVNGNDQTSISMARNKRTEGPDKDKKQGGSIFAGDFNKTEDNITKRKKKLLQDALKVMMDQFESDSKIDEGIDEKRQNIADNKSKMKEANTAINVLQQEREAIREKHGVEAGSQEQQDLELIEKGRKAEAQNKLSDLSEDELTRLAEMGPLTDYQKESLSYADIQDEYRKELNSAKDVIANESRIIEGTKQSLLSRKYDMSKASRTTEQMLISAAKEIAGMLQAEAKDNIDKEFKELQEAAAKAAEKKKEQEEAIEKAKEEKEGQEQVKEQKDPAKYVASIQDSVTQELKKIAEAQKLLEEDLKGIVVDNLL